ncbi:hypothetical protein LTR17_006532 [Elasticomyces elasticus]|nr:hypothetical protein LTR17_006532 [Elasticomyces elasticus]
MYDSASIEQAKYTPYGGIDESESLEYGGLLQILDAKTHCLQLDNTPTKRQSLTQIDIAMQSAQHTLSLKPQCQVCGGEDPHFRCGGCQAVRYCGHEHQTSDWTTHKASCVPVKKALAKMSREETKLRNAPEDFGFAGNPFDPQNDSIGHFWGIHETRDYMRARYGVVEALMKIKTREAVQANLDHLLDMLRLCRGDNMGVRSLVPALYIRLGRDQDAYDFVRWYKKVDEDGDYD